MVERRALLVRTSIIGVFAAVVAVAMVVRFSRQGPPYFGLPVTPLDHVIVGGGEHPTIPVIRVCKRIAPRLPRGATVLVFVPSQAPHFDTTVYGAAIAVLERMRVVAPPLRDPLPDFVVAVGEPLDHRSYKLLEQFPEGSLYKRTP